MRPWHHLTFTDVVAVLVLIIAGIGMYLGVEGDFSAALALIAGYYFGKKSSTLPPSHLP